jgi:hypothetical protein
MIMFLRRLFRLDKFDDRVPTIENPSPYIRPPAVEPSPSEATPPSEEAVTQAFEDLRFRLRADIAAGFLSRELILEGAVDYVEDQIDPALARAEAERLWPQLVTEHREIQAEWPEQTDCDRLDAAFAALEAAGIISRQNFSCCGTCGSAEIGDEIGAAEDAGLPAHGYAFYHMQDTDSATEGSGLYLNYGACEEGEDAALAVANQIVAELEAHGLSTAWTGSWNQRIAVPLEWKRRSDYAV